ncbi:cyclopropane-fatty-acyl-phospholipid synthase family protein [Variovorax sp. H27-G14]|uniref:class I SAM-dependent methyltransferase n=1 Tax=Variovorax sp. H27-G14 TaxID=3111914 RepID=UPI0038FCA792
MKPGTGELHSALAGGEADLADAVFGQSHAPADRDVTVRKASRLLARLFDGFACDGAIRLWDGMLVPLGPARNATPAFTLVFRNPQVIGAMVLGRERLRLAEAYFRGDIDIEGDFFKALGLKDHLMAIRLSWADRLRVLAPALRLAWPGRGDGQLSAAGTPLHADRVKAHSKSENRVAVQFHYDLSNAFYALWLDRAMVYSCAYFASPVQGLDEAQAAKLDHICRKLRLQPQDRLLDIGCGWGALLLHAAKHYGVEAHGVTLSRKQLAVAQQRIAAAGLGHRVTVELRDYRDLGAARYDKIASVGMFEHVGLRNLPAYFDMVHRLLKPGGVFLNHGITHHVEGWKKTLSTEFINRYIFPDGQLDTVSNVQRVMEASGFEIADVESLRSHYALTLRHWVRRLESHHAEALQFVNEATYRVWRLYMAACALEFESGEIGVYQLLATRRDGGVNPLPLTRAHLYATGVDKEKS